MAGRKPKPSAIHDLHGNPGKRARNKNEPKPEPVKNPSAPKYLDRRAAYLWRVLAKELEPLLLLGKIDLNALARYCECYSVWREAMERRKADGITVFKKAVDRDGNEVVLSEVVAPWVNVADKMSKEMRGIESAIGMGGAANRARVGATGKKKTDPIADFLNSGKKLAAVK